MDNDLISRQAAIEKVRKISGLIVSMTTEGHETILVDKAQVQTELMMLPSAERDYKFDEWCTDCKEYDKERHCCPRFNKVIRTALQEVQENQKNGEWIPCSERLPEEGKEVLISSDGGIYIAELEIFDGNVYWNETIEYRLVNGVSAWCPLPKPYKGKEE